MLSVPAIILLLKVKNNQDHNVKYSNIIEKLTPL